MSNSLKSLQNLLGWHTKKKIIVFESDDWGSDRFTLESKKYYAKRDIDITSNWMSRFDTFESKEDIQALFEILTENNTRRVKPKMTFLFNPANPDFRKIREGNFETYYYQTFTEKLAHLGTDGSSLLALYNTGLQDNFLELAFHGREHLYVNRWLRDLKSGNKIACEGFTQGVWGFSKAYLNEYMTDYRASFDLDFHDDLSSQAQSIIDGIQIMNNEFNTDVRYFLAPNGPFSLSLVSSLAEANINYIGLGKRFRDVETKRTKLFWLGKSVSKDLKTIVRNAVFEPSSPQKTDWVNSCLQDISQAFKWKKPAVISTHRANYVGGLEQDNRSNGIMHLRELLLRIYTHWPDVVFLTSSQLGDVISGKLDLDEVY